LAGYRIDGQIVEFGEHVRGWRMVLGLTAQQVAERAGITRDTLRKVETGDPTVSFSNVAQVLRALGVLDKTVEACAMTTVEVFVDEAGCTRSVGRAHFTRTRGQISTTFYYDPDYLPDEVDGPRARPDRRARDCHDGRVDRSAASGSGGGCRTGQRRPRLQSRRT
jgi:transcriptional regulator with XRE-family HTH domain